jgi:hypothetical protein
MVHKTLQAVDILVTNRVARFFYDFYAGKGEIEQRTAILFSPAIDAAKGRFETIKAKSRAANRRSSWLLLDP